MLNEDFLLHLLSQYGYLVVVIGTFLEGESIVILAGSLVQHGVMSFYLLCLSAFVGSLASDQLMFFIGHKYGVNFIEKRPKLSKAQDKLKPLLNNYETWLMLGFRFVYGVRNVTPIILGANRANPLKFLFLNSIGAGVWAISFSAIGYGLSGILERFFGKIDILKHMSLIIFILLLIAICIILFKYVRHKKD